MQSLLASHQHIAAFLLLAAAGLHLARARWSRSSRRSSTFSPSGPPNDSTRTGRPTSAGISSTALCPIFLLGPPVALIAVIIHAVLPASLTGAAAGLPLWARMIAAMVVGEIGFYWGHRWSHEIPLLWRFHAVHHSAEHVNFLVNTRAHPVDMVFTRLCGLTLLYATGLASPVGPNPSSYPRAGSLDRRALELLHSRQSEVAPRSARRGAVEPRLPPLAPHPRRPQGPQLLLDAPGHGPRLRHLLPAAEWPKDYGTDTPVPDGLIGQLLDPLAPSLKARDLGRGISSSTR